MGISNRTPIPLLPPSRTQGTLPLGTGPYSPQIGIPAQIIYQIHKTDIETRPGDPYAPYQDPFHCIGHHSKYMFHPHPDM
jgi:hypothetical protein